MNISVLVEVVFFCMLSKIKKENIHLIVFYKK